MVSACPATDGLIPFAGGAGPSMCTHVSRPCASHGLPGAVIGAQCVAAGPSRRKELVPGPGLGLGEQTLETGTEGLRTEAPAHLWRPGLPRIIGCQVQREPPNSTQRYTRWLNQLEPGQLLTQAFTSHGPTVPMPTWFCSRAWFSHVGPFDEGGRGVPEDLLFFYEHLRKGGGVVRVDRSLLMYRYHPAAATHAVLETTIWTLRVRFLEEQALPRWATFTIWNAGRQGRRLYRSLTAESRRKVVAFCDVDENKIQKGFYCHEESQERPKPRVPVLHFRAARPPFVICVKLDLTGGAVEDNLRSLHLREGRDFLHFS
uniref:UDP-GlcNAc:betaGal beta-1,3-N-acetylglucosaminyltransferase like 1 n=1 Tax=Sus scrofa TaxID=9823 RepID=A0A8D1BYM2_PIG